MNYTTKQMYDPMYDPMEEEDDTMKKIGNPTGILRFPGKAADGLNELGGKVRNSRDLAIGARVAIGAGIGLFLGSCIAIKATHALLPDGGEKTWMGKTLAFGATLACGVGGGYLGAVL